VFPQKMGSVIECEKHLTSHHSDHHQPNMHSINCDLNFDSTEKTTKPSI
jgi:hypothetical protein